MAEAAQGLTKGVQGKTSEATGGATDSVTDRAQGVTSGAQSGVQGVTSGVLGKVQSFGSSITGWGQGLLDRFFPPEQRAAFLAKLKGFMLANPKLSTFLGMNIALTGVPLGLFILFSITIFLFALIVGLVVGLLAAVLFTLFCVGLALSVVFPLIFFTTLAACFLFLWGLAGYHLLKWVNSDGKDAPEGSTIGDKLNSFTGGRLSGFLDSAKAERSKDDISGFDDKNTKPHQAPAAKARPNGAAAGGKKNN